MESSYFTLQREERLCKVFFTLWKAFFLPKVGLKIPFTGSESFFLPIKDFSSLLDHNILRQGRGRIIHLDWDNNLCLAPAFRIR
jgi:hypothetical protein